MIPSQALTEEKKYTEHLCLFYFSDSSRLSAFCNQAEIPVTIDNISFLNNEQYILYKKAQMFGETSLMQQILECKNRQEMKLIVFKSKNFNEVQWNSQLPSIVETCNFFKFNQHEVLKTTLLQTEDFILAEASYDRVFGIGVNYVTGQQKSRWIGGNLQGEMLMKVRAHFKEGTLPSFNLQKSEDAQQQQQVDNECLIKVMPNIMDTFGDVQILMQGETWSLEQRMLHPLLLESWKNVVMRAPVQQRPVFGPMWDGRSTRSKRNVEFFSTLPTSYEISRKQFPAVELSTGLKQILGIVNEHRSECYNAMIINEYVDETQKIGYHSDNPLHLGKNGVDTLSLGETRICIIRKKTYGEPGEIVMKIPCVDGSLLSMMGDFQKEFTHEIVDEPTKSLKVRRSVTFRWMKPDL